MTVTSFIYQFHKTIKKKLKLKTESFLVCYHCVASSDRFCELRFASPIQKRSFVGDGDATDDDDKARRSEIEARSDLEIVSRYGLLLLRRVALRRRKVRRNRFSELLLDPLDKSLLICDLQRDSAVRFECNGFARFFWLFWNC